jgi:hypothetical protein
MDKPNPLEMIKLVEQDNLEVAEKLALESLSTRTPEDVASRCGATIEGDHLTLVYLGTPLAITIPDYKVVMPDGREMNPYERVLVLHYLSGEGPVRAAGDPITFKEVPSGPFYDAAFQRRARNPLLGVFGEDPARAVRAAEALGGRPLEHGDVAVTIPAFPNVQIILVFHEGDEEFPPEVGLLLSGNITSYLSTEDIATLAGMTAWKLIKGANK